MPAQKNVEWRRLARADYDRFLDQLAEENLAAAIEFDSDLTDKLTLIRSFPHLYRESSRVEGVREMVIRPNFFLVYRVSPTTIRILNFVHARRDWPNPPRPPARRKKSSKSRPSAPRASMHKTWEGQKNSS